MHNISLICIHFKPPCKTPIEMVTLHISDGHYAITGLGNACWAPHRYLNKCWRVAIEPQEQLSMKDFSLENMHVKMLFESALLCWQFPIRSRDIP